VHAIAGQIANGHLTPGLFYSISMHSQIQASFH